jgi:aspartate aminotransferase
VVEVQVADRAPEFRAASGYPCSMQLSERANAIKPSATLAVTAKVRELTARGIDVIAFGAGEPDFDTPANIKQAAIDALLAGKTKYTATEGEPAARSAIAEKLARENGITCGPQDIVITVGAKHACYLAMQALVNPGQSVLLPTPAWVSYAPMIELAGGSVVEVPGAMDNDFKITPAQLESAIARSGRSIAAIILNTPSNPCGTMYSEQELRDLGEVLEAHEQIAIVTDEIYEKLTYGQVEHFSLGSVERLAHRVVTLNGLSKAFAMTGWRVGYACAPGPLGVAKAMIKLQGQMTSNITSFVYPAIVEALTNGAATLEAMRQSFAQRAALIHGLMTRMPGVRCARPTGAFYIFPDISDHFGRRSPRGAAITSSATFAAALLDEAHVAVVPGEEFGEAGRPHVRLSFACSTKNIEEGCRRMHAWLDGLR